MFTPTSPPCKMLTRAELEKLPFRRLMGIIKSVRAITDSIEGSYGPRCCEWCREYIGNDWENDVAKFARPFREYMEILKDVSHKHPNVPDGFKLRGPRRGVPVQRRDRRPGGRCGNRARHELQALRARSA